MPRAPHLRRGLTFVEVVCAVAIVGVIAAAAMAAVGSIVSAQERQLRRLGAAELANRLILQYMDDQDALPPRGMPLSYAGASFRWELKETKVRIEPARPEVAAERARFTPLTLDRLTNVAVTVWLAEDSGGSAAPVAGVPAFQITRIFDPIPLIHRNPDSLRHRLEDPIAYQRMLQQFIGGGGGGGGPATPRNRGNTPSGPPGSNPPKGKEGGR